MIRNFPKPESNLVLIGCSGSGKTTISPVLSGRLEFRCLDIDKEIENVCGCPISDIFKKHGEPYFRGVETRVAEKAAQMKGTVIATGGGIVKNKANMDLLAKNGFIIYLKTTARQAYFNTLNDKGRPLLEATDKEQAIAELLRRREPLYEKYSHLTVSVAGKAVEEIVNEILKTIGVDVP